MNFDKPQDTPDDELKKEKIINRELLIKREENLAKIYEIWQQVQVDDQADGAELKFDEETSVLYKELSEKFKDIFRHLDFIRCEIVKLSPDKRRELLVELDSTVEASAIKFNDTFGEKITKLNLDQRKELIQSLSKEVEGLLEKIEKNVAELSLEQEAARRKVEIALFNERIEQFTEADTELDNSEAFEAKIRAVFPEISDPERLRDIKTGIGMHFLEKYSQD